MQNTIFDRKPAFYKAKFADRQAKQNPRPPNWWTPVWRGLIADPNSKHRKAMGSAVWMYLYLLTYTNRKTGIVRRPQQAMAQDTGYPLRTIQFNLQKLSECGYLTKEREGRYIRIHIDKWKAFTDPKKDNR